jgi:hypothetical protein
MDLIEREYTLTDEQKMEKGWSELSDEEIDRLVMATLFPKPTWEKPKFKVVRNEPERPRFSVIRGGLK